MDFGIAGGCRVCGRKQPAFWSRFRIRFRWCAARGAAHSRHTRSVNHRRGGVGVRVCGVCGLCSPAPGRGSGDGRRWHCPSISRFNPAPPSSWFSMASSQRRSVLSSARRARPPHCITRTRLRSSTVSRTLPSSPPASSGPQPVFPNRWRLAMMGPSCCPPPVDRLSFSPREPISACSPALPARRR